jgi:hypothetical protein
MINFDLALLIKEKGFPKEVYSIGDVYYFESDKGEIIKKILYPQDLNNLDNLKNKAVFVPSLEELIRECGSGLKNITRVFGGWSVNFRDEFGYPPFREKELDEVLAKLWYSLNDK